MRRGRGLRLHAPQASESGRRPPGDGGELARRPAIRPHGCRGRRTGRSGCRRRRSGTTSRRTSWSRRSRSSGTIRASPGPRTTPASRSARRRPPRPWSLRGQPARHPRSARQRLGVDRHVLAQLRRPEPRRFARALHRGQNPGRDAQDMAVRVHPAGAAGRMLGRLPSRQPRLSGSAGRRSEGGAARRPADPAAGVAYPIRLIAARGCVPAGYGFPWHPHPGAGPGIGGIARPW